MLSKKRIFFLISFILIYILVGILTFEQHQLVDLQKGIDTSLSQDQSILYLGEWSQSISRILFIAFGQGIYFLVPLCIILISTFYKPWIPNIKKFIAGYFITLVSICGLIILFTKDTSAYGGGIISGTSLFIIDTTFGLFGKLVAFPLGFFIGIHFLLQKNISDYQIQKKIKLYLYRYFKLKDMPTTPDSRENPSVVVKEDPISAPLESKQKIAIFGYQKWIDRYIQYHAQDLPWIEKTTENTSQQKWLIPNTPHPDNGTFTKEIHFNQPSLDDFVDTDSMDTEQIHFHEPLSDSILNTKEIYFNEPHLNNIMNTDQIHGEKHISPTSPPAKTSIEEHKINSELDSNNTQETLMPNELDKIEQGNDELSNEVILEELESAKQKIRDTLQEFGIEVEITKVSRGPVITCYEILPPPGLKLSKIVNLQDNIAMRLACAKIRIIAPIPGKSAVGIEIPNQKRQTVSLLSLIEEVSDKLLNKDLPVILGLGGAGEHVVSNLAEMPHLLVAGTTGSGKSMFINTLICSLLSKKKPDELKILMIDPKRVELKRYDPIPHLLCPVITEPKKALLSLKWLVGEMENRYKRLEHECCRDIYSFNEKQGHLPKEEATLLPFIVAIIDEFADLIMLSGRELEETIARLAAMARAVGIHLVIATQRPSVDVITGLIKANFPTRISFQVSSRTESRIILDQNGAEQLLGKGDLLFSTPSLDGLYRIQGPFIQEHAIYKLTQVMVNQFQAQPDSELKSILDRVDEEEANNGDLASAEQDPLYQEAVSIVINEQRASASYLQRRMRIGYNRAARMIEYMEEQKMISPANGSKPREILVS